MFTQFNLYLGICYLSDVYSTDTSLLSYQIQYLICRTVLFGALLFFNFKYLRPRFRRLVEVLGKEWRSITLAAFFFYVLEAVILYFPRFYWYEADNRWYLVASSYLMFFSVYLLIFRSINAIVGKYEEQERGRILAQQNKLWEEQLAEQKNAVSAARRDRHDLRHHFDTLLAMLSGGKTQESVFNRADAENGGARPCRTSASTPLRTPSCQDGRRGQGRAASKRKLTRAFPKSSRWTRWRSPVF